MEISMQKENLSRDSNYKMKIYHYDDYNYFIDRYVFKSSRAVGMKV